MNWNTDISRAPHGHYDVQTRRVKDGKTADHRVFNREIVWTASSCGKVMRSYYLPEERRWCMYSHLENPVAWIEFDEARDRVEITEGKVTRIEYRCPLAHPYASREAA